MHIYIVILLAFLENVVQVYNRIWLFSPHIPPYLLPYLCQQTLLPISPCSTFLSFCLFWSPLSLLRALCVTTGLQLPIRVGLDSWAGIQMCNRPPLSQHQSVNSSSAGRGGASELHPELAEERCSLVDLTQGNTPTVSGGWVTAKRQHLFTALFRIFHSPPFSSASS